MKNNKRRAFNFEIKKDTVIALITAIAMLPVYYINMHYGYQYPIIFVVVFLIFGHLILNTIIPALVVIKLNGETLDGLGITKNKLVISLLISIAIALLSYYQLLAITQDRKDVNLIPHIIFNSLVLWEVLFVYGWLQLRFEKAFGYLIAPVLSAICFCFYHIGSVPLAELTNLLFAGLFFSIIFSITRNIFTLFPIAWSTSSGIGTIMAGVVAGWSEVLIYLVILLIQIGILFFINKKYHLNKIK